MVSDLQRRLEEHTAGAHESEDELVKIKVKHIEEIGALQSRLVETSSAFEEAQVGYLALEVAHSQSLSDIDRVQDELDKQLRLASEATNASSASREREYPTETGLG